MLASAMKNASVTQKHVLSVKNMSYLIIINFIDYLLGKSQFIEKNPKLPNLVSERRSGMILEAVTS